MKRKDMNGYKTMERKNHAENLRKDVSAFALRQKYAAYGVGYTLKIKNRHANAVKKQGCWCPCKTSRYIF